MGLQFEGAIDNITERQLSFIQDVLEKRGYKDTTVTVEAVGQAGDNYIANVKRIIVNDGDNEFRMIAKIAPQILKVRMSTQTDKLFKNEHIMYTKVLPKYQELEERADLLKEERLRFAECYGSLSDAPDEVILLEDLQVPGFRMLDRFKPLPDDCVTSILKNFAKLHSLSYALKYKEPDTFNDFAKDFFDLWGTMDGAPEIANHFTHLENTAASMVEGEDKKKYFKGCIFQSISLAAKMLKQDGGSKYYVIQQGDSWTNNILFKYDGDKLEQSIMIDYQLSKENNPAYDLMYMIFNCTDHKSRLEHFNDWIDLYHTELDKALSNFGLKANFVYPKDQLDADLKRYGRIMLGVCVILASVSIMKSEDAAKMKVAMERQSEEKSEVDMIGSDKEFIGAFKSRVQGLIDSFLHFGLL